MYAMISVTKGCVNCGARVGIHGANWIFQFFQAPVLWTECTYDLFEYRYRVQDQTVNSKQTTQICFLHESLLQDTTDRASTLRATVPLRGGQDSKLWLGPQAMHCIREALEDIRCIEHGTERTGRATHHVDLTKRNAKLDKSKSDRPLSHKWLRRSPTGKGIC